MEVETQTLKDTAEQALIGLIQSVTDAAAFLKGEIPVAVQELLTYYAVWTAAEAVLLLCGIGIVVYLARRLWKWCGKEGYREMEQIFGTAALVVAGGFMAVGVVFNISEFLKITLAPRIWLIEYAASLVK